MGKIDKGVKCNVTGCSEQAIRSISLDKISSAGMNIVQGRRGYLCRKHYKELKKRLKKDKQIDKWRMMG